MDLFTHFLVPFIILTILKSRNRLAGAFGGISLDFDTIFVAGIGILFPQLFIFSHRGITHSFFFAFFTSLIFLYVISRKPLNNFISKLIKRDISVDFNQMSVLIAFFGALLHLFLDYLTARGIPLLYPFSLTKYSGELYQNIDLFTMLLAATVLLILYLKTKPHYKKIAMAVFIIVLVTLGGIRAVEKINVLEAASLNENFTELAIYPTSNVFHWQVVTSNPPNTSYLVYDYNTLKKEKFNQKKYITPLIQNGSYESGLAAIYMADSNPLVKRFKWNSQYSLVMAHFQVSGWNITYYDIVDSYSDDNISVIIPNTS